MLDIDVVGIYLDIQHRYPGKIVGYCSLLFLTTGPLLKEIFQNPLPWVRRIECFILLDGSRDSRDLLEWINKSFWRPPTTEDDV